MINNTASYCAGQQNRLAISLLLVSMLLLSGCISQQARVSWQKTYKIPVHSSISLFQPLTIPARHTQVFLQDGKAVYSSGYNYGYDQYYPFCFFEVHDVIETEQTISADRFIITSVHREETEIVQTKPIKLASLIVSNDYDTASLIVQTLIMRLHSDKQPGLKRLVCGGGFDSQPFAELPTIEQIEHTLGDIAKLKIKDIQ